MRYRQLGSTGLLVSELELGTMTFGPTRAGDRYAAIADVDQDTADEMVATALAAGVNLIDTADVYSSGEHGLGAFAESPRQGVTRQHVRASTCALASSSLAQPPRS